MRIVLIGYRGTGKSTVARELAARLGWQWRDSDDEIEARTGKTIAALFADDGEDHFRDVEAAVLAEFSVEHQLVLSAGGGAVLRPRNRQLLAAESKIIWLRATPETILARLSEDSQTSARRPALTEESPATEIIQLLRQRTPIYQQCADVVVDTDQRTPAEVAAEVLRQLDLTP